MTNVNELACAYSALILADDDVAVTVRKYKYYLFTFDKHVLTSYMSYIRPIISLQCKWQIGDCMYVFDNKTTSTRDCMMSDETVNHNQHNEQLNITYNILHYPNWNHISIVIIVIYIYI